MSDRGRTDVSNSTTRGCGGAARLMASLMLSTTVLAASAMVATPAHAQATRAYAIPAGALPDVLNAFARQAGVELAYRAELTNAARSGGLSGTVGVAEGLSRILAGTGITYRQTGPRAFTLEPGPAGAGGDAVQLGPVRVEGAAARGATAPAQGEIGTLPPPFAGGQVARGSRAGLLGNRDYMDTPFSITSYTAQAVRDQQATSIAEVLTNSDPSVRTAIGSTNRYDAITIRGFRVDNEELMLNGLYGLVPPFRVNPDPVERIELIKGAGALLNGMLPFGSVGGGVNIVTKRAEDAPLTRLSAEYMGDAWFGGHVDLGRRFGTDGAFGVRINGAYRDGDTRIDDQSRRNGTASLGLDYRGDRLRLSADLIYQNDHFNRAARGYTPVPGIAVPRAPDPKTNIAQAFDYSQSTSLTGMVRGEFDVTPAITLFGAVGGNDFDYDKQEDPGATLLDAAGTARSVSRYQQGEYHSLSAEAGLRARFATGGVDHLLVVQGTTLKQTTWFGMTTYASYLTNIYDPVALASPGAIVSSFAEGKDSHNLMRSVAVADTLSVSDGLVQLTLGVRHQQVRTGSFAASGAKVVTYDETATTPSFALVVRPTGTLSLYANYIEALSAGASPPPEAANPSQVFPPYKSKQYEVGTKLDLGRFGATLGLFQIAVPSGIVDPVTRIYDLNGKQRHRGVELNGFGELGAGVRLLGGVTWLDARLRRTQDGLNDGHHAVGAPSFQGTLGVEWDTPFLPGFTVTGRAIHTGKAYVSADNRQHVPGWTRFDLGARYATSIADRDVVLRAEVGNLFGKDYWEANPTGYLISGAPRTLRLSAAVDF